VESLAAQPPGALRAGLRVHVRLRQGPAGHLESPDGPESGGRPGEAIPGIDYPGKLHRTRPEGPRKNIWYYDVEKKTYGHPAVFPLPLAVDHILSWTNPGDTVLDPFLGSGTVLEACFHTGRRGIGIDISPDYLAIAERRIAAARAAMPLFAPSEAR
jgi:hypothetical protein